MSSPSDSQFPDHSSSLVRARRGLLRFLDPGARPSARATMRTTVAILRAQQEATLDGILVVDRSGRVLSYNRRFLEIWGIPEHVARGGDDNELLGYAASKVADWDAFIDLVNYLYSHPDEVRTDDAVDLNDGRVLSRSSVPVVSDGVITGRAWYFRDVSDAHKAARLEQALFRIPQLSRASTGLDQFYRSLHHIVGELMDASNFYIAEYDAASETLTFPYFVDEYDAAPGPRPVGHGLTAYVLRTGEPLLATPELFEDLKAKGEVQEIGTPSVDWLGVPLKSGERTWGVIGVQSYEVSTRYHDREKEILIFVAQHVALAIEQRRQEDAVRASERRYRQMFENNRAVQLVIDPATGAILDANMAACDFYGYVPGELRSMRLWDITVMDEDTIRAEMKRAAGQECNYFVFRHRLSSGEIRDVEIHSGPIDAGGRTLLYSIIHDITERKRAEERLLQSEERYRNIFDYASVGIYQSTVDGRFITANATLARILGYDSVSELLARNLEHDIYSDPNERAELIRVFAPRHFATDYEVRWKRKDGTPIWVQLNAHAIRSDDGPAFFEGFVYDITERKRAEERLASSNAQRKAVLDAATRISIIATSPQGTIMVFNPGAERMLGWTADEVIGKRSLLELHAPSEIVEQSRALAAEFGIVAGFDALVARAAARGVEEREWTYVRRDGEPISVIVSVTAIRDSSGRVTGFLHVGTDITARKQAEEQLRRQSAAMTASMDGIGILDERLELTYSNDALAKLFGYGDPRDLARASLCDLYEPPEQVRFVTSIVPTVQQRGRWRGEATGLRRDASTFPQEISLTAIEGGAMVAVVRDITERTYAEEQIKHLAYHDALTGLPNRLLFKDRLTVALAHAQRTQSRLAVLFLDLDRFKIINDSLGHNAGDQLLQAVAARLPCCVRESDTVARLGGDEFTLLLASLAHSDDIAPIAEKILDALREPFQIDGREIYTSTSIGISLYPEDGADAETLIKSADTAMYQAKEQGRDNYQLFNAFVNARALQRIALEHALRRALANNELEIHYQPIYDFRAARVTGMEALLRWRSRDFGMISPVTFIPLAESTGMMHSIGGWALRTACSQAKTWHDAGFDDLTLSVNLSVTQLQSLDLVERVQQTLAETGFEPSRLELEITESGAMQSPETNIRMLQDLKKLGIRLSLDDFGTGHSSLAYLRRFPIDTLKIDQSFVRDISGEAGAPIVQAIIAMAHSLRLRVIAEGVENESQMDFLRINDCDQMQGYLLRPPLPASDFLACVGRRESHTTPDDSFEPVS